VNHEHRFLHFTRVRQGFRVVPKLGIESLNEIKTHWTSESLIRDRNNDNDQTNCIEDSSVEK
jgi:hypothetical protein